MFRPTVKKPGDRVLNSMGRWEEVGEEKTMDLIEDIKLCPEWELTPYGEGLGYVSADALLGFIPLMLSTDDPRPAREQFDARYAHGGGWRPMAGWKRWGIDPSDLDIAYEGEERHRALAKVKFGDETIVFYESSWVAIFQPDLSFEVSRMD